VLTSTLSPNRAAGLRDGVRRSAGSFDPVLIAALTAAVCLPGASRPSLWFDEAATISASKSRSLAELWQLLGNIDAVHGLYYLLMHGWFAVFPVTEFWSRLPSGIAAAGAAAGVVVLAKRFSTRRVAVCSGIAFAILPRTTWAGIEARSYAFSALVAVWLTVLLVAVVRRNRPGLWVLYALALLVSMLLNVFLVFLVPVYAALLTVFKPTRSAVVWFAGTSCAVLMTVTPFILFAQGQKAQIDWITPLGTRTVGDVLVRQYFSSASIFAGPNDDSLPFAIASGVLIAAAILLRRRQTRPPGDGTRQLLTIAVAWIAIPTTALLIYSALIEPLYYPRYLYFTAPAMAIVLGACVVSVAKKPVPIAVVYAVLAIAAAPNYLFVQRSPYAKERMDFSQVADVVTNDARAGDCLLLDNTASWKPGPIRALTAARPSAYSKLKDPGLGRPAAKKHTLWDEQLPVWSVVGQLKTCEVIWTVSDRDKSMSDHDRGVALAPGPRLARAPCYQIAHQLGFRLVERWQFSFAQLTKASR
jgi:mannosyltransferase